MPNNKLLSKIPFYGIALIFIILIVSLFKLQVVQGEDYKQIAEENYVRIKNIQPVRGEILDREYRPIAINKPSYNLYIILGKIREKDKVIDFVSRNFAIEKEKIKETIYQNRFRLYQEIRLVQNIDYEKLIAISEQLNYFPSLFFKTETRREYLYPNHFTGYVGRIDEQEFSKLKDKGYSINSMLGKSGLEKYYEEMLAGKSGYEILQVDAAGNNLQFFKHNLEKKPENGESLILTIDNELQEYISSIFPGKAKGCIVVSDIKNGEILAYISKPDFDQNIFGNNLSTDDWNKILQDPSKPMLDRVIHGTYPPGSVYKPVMAFLGLEENVIDKKTKLTKCDGGMQFGDRYFKCWWEKGHGRLNVVDAIKQSCDVFFYDLSTRFTLEQINNYTKKNKLCVRIGIDLPGERAGFFPTKDWYKQNYGRYISITGQKVNIAIGQGEVLVTPLQICSFYAAIGNDGIWKQPHFLLKTVEHQKNTTFKQEYLPVNREHLELIQKSLYKVVNEQYGTGTAAGVYGVKVYGKTGSAENHMGKETHAWFTGYAEWEEPEIAFVVFLENAGHGGSAAAPLARKIVKFYDWMMKER